MEPVNMREEERNRLYIAFSSPLTVFKMPEALRFYEVDQTLQNEDRLQIAQEINQVKTNSFRWTLLASLGATGIPTLREYVMRARGKAPVEFPASAPKKTPVFRFPFFSISLGLLTYGIAGTMIFMSNFEKQKIKVDKRAQADEYQEQNKRIQNVWSLIKPYQASFWITYFELTYQDPSFLMGDPRNVRERLRTDPKYQFANMGRPVIPDSPDSQDQKPSEWQHIRDINFPPPAPQNENSVDMVQEPGYSGNQPVSGSSRPKSRWDEIREGK